MWSGLTGRFKHCLGQNIESPFVSNAGFIIREQECNFFRNSARSPHRDFIIGPFILSLISHRRMAQYSVRKSVSVSDPISKCGSDHFDIIKCCALLYLSLVKQESDVNSLPMEALSRHSYLSILPWVYRKLPICKTRQDADLWENIEMVVTDIISISLQCASPHWKTSLSMLTESVFRTSAAFDVSPERQSHIMIH